MSDPLHILHYNDVYHVIPRPDRHPILQFHTLLTRLKGQQPGALQLFSGDAFGGSRLSTSTTGKAMAQVMDKLKPDACVIGNHELDHSYGRMAQLIGESELPWVLSNITSVREQGENGVAADYGSSEKIPNEDKYPMRAPYKPFHVIPPGPDRKFTVGIIGLMDKDCYKCAQRKWERAGLHYDNITRVGLEMSTYLRQQKNCDIVIALTHARLTDDVIVARALNALSPAAQAAMNTLAATSGSNTFSKTPGVDLLLGGHDHFYYMSSGVKPWGDAEVDDGRERDIEGQQSDSVLIVKSGTNFADLSGLKLTLAATAEAGSIRNVVISGIECQRFRTRGEPPDADFRDNFLAEIMGGTRENEKLLLGYFKEKFDTHSGTLRKDESLVGNWVTNMVRNYYTIEYPDYHIDGVLLNSGSIRDWGTERPNSVQSLGDLLETFPFDGDTVVLKLTGADIWAALNNAFSKYPADAGRFPVISGFRVTWDSGKKRRNAQDREVLDEANRVTGVWLLSSGDRQSMDTNPVKDKEDRRGTWIPNAIEAGKTYNIVTLAYLARGNDGFDVLEKDPVTTLSRDPVVATEEGTRLDVIMTTTVRDRFMYDPSNATNKSAVWATTEEGECEDRYTSRGLPTVVFIERRRGVDYLPPNRVVSPASVNSVVWNPARNEAAEDYAALTRLATEANIPLTASFKEWAERRRGLSLPLPVYSLRRDGRVFDEARAAE